MPRRNDAEQGRDHGDSRQAMTTDVRPYAAGATEIARAFATDEDFARWYDRTMPRVFSYLVSRTSDGGLAEELTQQTFVAAVEQRWRFDGRADGVTWLCAIARHKLADHFR